MRRRVKYGPLADRLFRWRRDQHIVDDGHRSVDGPLSIRTAVRGAIAMKQMGYSVRASAVVLGRSPEEVHLHLTRIEQSENPIAMQIVRRGLPGWASVPLPHGTTIRCKSCNYKISNVPCVACGPTWGEPPIEEDIVEPEVEPLQAAEATDSVPGSAARMEVYRLRYAAGLAVFHEEDTVKPRDRFADSA